MKFRFRPKVILSAIGTIAITAGLTLFAVAPANAAVSGTVECDAGGYNVVGVWIDSTNNAHDGFASWTPLSGWPEKATYSKGDIAVNESYSVHVGCGGNTTTWGQTAYSGPVTGGQEFVCHVTATVSQRVCLS